VCGEQKLGSSRNWPLSLLPHCTFAFDPHSVCLTPCWCQHWLNIFGQVCLCIYLIKASFREIELCNHMWLWLFSFVSVSLAVTWSPCPVYTDPKIPPPANITADCATLPACLEYKSNCTQLDLFVKRVNAVAERQGQIWLLQGGPGTFSLWFQSIQLLLPLLLFLVLL
jgi:hypothetical protein